MQSKQPTTPPLLIILAGLPGTGKTTLARLLAKEFSLAYLRVDCIEAPYLARQMMTGPEGYEALIHLARENLKLNLGVVIDTVNPLHKTRRMFLELARETTAKTIQFELKMNDVLLHKKRIETRTADIPELPLPTWQDVCSRNYETWDEATDGRVNEIWSDDGQKAFLQCLEIINANINDRIQSYQREESARQSEQIAQRKDRGGCRTKQ